jgi:shikimate dehydrogenase
MHTFILNALGVECRYDAISLKEEEFAGRIEDLLATYDAINVTIPFKQTVIPYLKHLEGDAAVFGAVNTILTAQQVGYNTDGYGFLLMITTEGVTLSGKRVLVLGAGGVGRSCIKKLMDVGAEVFAYERSRERIEEVYREFGGFTVLDEVEPKPYDIIINCTGIGMHNTVGQTPSVCTKNGELPVGEELLSLCETAVDLIYVPTQSEFLRIASSLGKQTVNGEAMLFYQAYRADCIYLDRTPNEREAKQLWNKYREGTL